MAGSLMSAGCSLGHVAAASSPLALVGQKRTFIGVRTDVRQIAYRYAQGEAGWVCLHALDLPLSLTWDLILLPVAGLLDVAEERARPAEEPPPAQGGPP